MFQWLTVVCLLFFILFVLLLYVPSQTAMVMAGRSVHVTSSKKVWDQARIGLATPGSAVRFVSVARHVTDCATQPGTDSCTFHLNLTCRIVADR